ARIRVNFALMTRESLDCFSRQLREFLSINVRTRPVGELGYEISNTKRRFIAEHFAVRLKIARRAENNDQRSIATFAGELSQTRIDLNNTLRIVLFQRMHGLLIEQISAGVVTGRSVGLETMTKITARYEGYRSTRLVNRFANAMTKLQMILYRKKAVAQRNDLSMPTVLQ